MARNQISFDFCENYVQNIDDDSERNNTNQRMKVAKIIKRIILEELTPSQREMCCLYYFEKMDMPTIAKRFSVNKSTVSRTIARGMKRVNDRVKYYSLR